MGQILAHIQELFNYNSAPNFTYSSHLHDRVPMPPGKSENFNDLKSPAERVWSSPGIYY